MTTKVDPGCSQARNMPDSEIREPNGWPVPRPDPRRVAEVVAKAFFAEMQQAGFSNKLIIDVTAQIISAVSGTLREQAKRGKKNATGEPPIGEEQGTRAENSEHRNSPNHSVVLIRPTKTPQAELVVTLPEREPIRSDLTEDR